MFVSVQEGTGCAGQCRGSQLSVAHMVGSQSLNQTALKFKQLLRVLFKQKKFELGLRT